MIRAEALTPIEVGLISPEGQHVAYALLADYESNLPALVNSMCGTSEVREYSPLSQERRKDMFTVIDDLSGTDYVYLPTITILGSFHGAILSREHDSLTNLAHESMLAGYNPDQALVEASRSDFMWDELMEGEISEFSTLASRYGWFRGKNNIPEVSELFNGYIIPRSEVRQLLGVLYDRAHEYRHVFGWGYPNWSGESVGVIS